MPERWWITVDGCTEGPYRDDELGPQRDAGRLTTASHVWRDGLAGWLPIQQSELAHLVAADASATAPAPARESVAELVGPPPAPAPFPGAGPGPGWSPPSASWSSEPRATSGSQGYSTAAIVCGLLAVLFVPIVLGPVAIGLAVAARRHDDPRADVAIVIAIAGMLLGFAIGALVAIW